jgi:CRP-like cAMP-binding protein
MNEWVRKTIGRYAPLNEEEWKAFYKYAKTVKLSPREVFLKAGAVADKAGFLKEGILRAFNADEQGNIITSYFYFVPNHDIVTLQTSFAENIPSVHTVEAITSCEIMYLEKNDLLQLYSKFHNFEKLGRIIAEKHYLETSKRAQSLQTMSARQLYKDFLAEAGDIVLHVPQNMIASYLGISQFTLSKIKNEL